MAGKLNDSQDNAKLSLVARGIFEQFVTELVVLDGYADTAAALKKSILESTSFNEASLRQALFGDTEL